MFLYLTILVEECVYFSCHVFLFFKQKTAYEMRISDWSSDVCSSDLTNLYALFLIKALDWLNPGGGLAFVLPTSFVAGPYFSGLRQEIRKRARVVELAMHQQREDLFIDATQDVCLLVLQRFGPRSEERRVGKECVSKCRSRG